VWGKDWLPGGKAALIISPDPSDNPGATQINMGSVPVPDSGEWQSSFVVPDTPPGGYNLIFSQLHNGCALNVTERFTVTGKEEKPPLPPQSTVRLDLTEGPAGTKVIATGTNWRAGEYILVTWEDGRQLAEVAIVNKRGEFSVEFAVPSDAPPGTYTIHFTSDSRYFLPALFRVSEGKPIPSKPFTCPVYFLGMHGTNQTADAEELKDTLKTFKSLVPPDTTVEHKFVEYNGNITFPKGDSISELTKLRRVSSFGR
jgi:hypothetical protein